MQPDVPVTRWRLSALGRRRLAHLLEQPWTTGLTRVVASTERKAIETAQALAEPLHLPVDLDHELGENDRSATGYLPPVEFEAVADEFFARPADSVRGWETARDAQRRIVAAVARAVDGADGADGSRVPRGSRDPTAVCADGRLHRPQARPAQAGQLLLLQPWDGACHPRVAPPGGGRIEPARHDAGGAAVTGAAGWSRRTRATGSAPARLRGRRCRPAPGRRRRRAAVGGWPRGRAGRSPGR